jgi:hypothetical protein
MTFIESTLVGVLSNPDEVSDKVALPSSFSRMMRGDSFAAAARYAVASEANVKSRLSVAIEEFRLSRDDR